MAPEAKKIQLRYGFEMEGETVTELTMRPPLARDSRDAQGGAASSADMEIRLFANLCEVTVAAVESLQMADYVLVQRAYEGFLA